MGTGCGKSPADTLGAFEAPPFSCGKAVEDVRNVFTRSEAKMTNFMIGNVSVLA